MTLTPFATSRSAAGRSLADVVLGTTQAPTGSYVDRSRVDRFHAAMVTHRPHGASGIPGRPGRRAPRDGRRR
ncbi:hypothetical protein ACIRP0_06815 [Streptomyces sp. NPDC101733]|uniref:hypothetical protein n=1 Tax=unclassified Streptomyces TaxID=2593676 RepID=UPI003807F4E1